MSRRAPLTGKGQSTSDPVGLAIQLRRLAEMLDGMVPMAGVSSNAALIAALGTTSTELRAAADQLAPLVHPKGVSD